MKTIEIEVPAKQAIAVEFPFYYFDEDTFDNGANYERAVKIEENGKTRAICKREQRGDEVAWELETGEVSIVNYGGYIKSGGQRPGAQEQFENLLSEFKKFHANF